MYHKEKAPESAHKVFYWGVEFVSSAHLQSCKLQEKAYRWKAKTQKQELKNHNNCYIHTLRLLKLEKTREWQIMIFASVRHKRRALLNQNRTIWSSKVNKNIVDEEQKKSTTFWSNVPWLAALPNIGCFYCMYEQFQIVGHAIYHAMHVASLFSVIWKIAWVPPVKVHPKSLRRNPKTTGVTQFSAKTLLESLSYRYTLRDISTVIRRQPCLATTKRLNTQ